MKLNWGTGIVIAFVAFIGFIVFFVVRMSTDDRANHDLVTEEYYKAELDFQKEIDAETNARTREMQLKVDKLSAGLRITFQSDLVPQNIKGTVYLYRPSDKNLDFDIPLRLSDTYLLIPDERLSDGRWDIKIAWTYDNQNYLYKEKITY
jgi:nitrogen fixation protein FixH